MLPLLPLTGDASVISDWSACGTDNAQRPNLSAEGGRPVLILKPVCRPQEIVSAFQSDQQSGDPPSDLVAPPTLANPVRLKVSDAFGSARSGAAGAGTEQTATELARAVGGAIGGGCRRPVVPELRAPTRRPRPRPSLSLMRSAFLPNLSPLFPMRTCPTLRWRHGRMEARREATPQTALTGCRAGQKNAQNLSSAGRTMAVELDWKCAAVCRGGAPVDRVRCRNTSGRDCDLGGTPGPGERAVAAHNIPRALLRPDVISGGSSGGATRT
jgi:hypothetical protein